MDEVELHHVNDCVFCGVLERDHDQRYDRLHLRGVTMYIAPTNELKKLLFTTRREARL
jgi:hypothetical protein